MKRTLFTGASGFIGYHFHQALASEEFGNIDLLEPEFDYHSSFIKGDIRKPEDVERAITSFACDRIVSLAAEHKDFGLSEEDYFKTNEKGTEVICEAATRHGIKEIIFYSSVAVYGNNKVPSDENLAPNPNLPYGASKLAGEKVLQRWCAEQDDRSVLIIRPTVVFGERNVANMFRLIHQIRAGRYFHIGDGKNIKSVAYVKNIVEATLHLMEKMVPGVSIYNYADEPQLTSREIATQISKSLNRKDPVTLPYWAVYALALPFDVLIKITGKDLPISTNRVAKFCTETFHKADKLLAEGFSPKYTTHQGLQNMVSWMEQDYKEDEKYFDV